mgnify:FL=1
MNYYVCGVCHICNMAWLVGPLDGSVVKFWVFPSFSFSKSQLYEHLAIQKAKKECLKKLVESNTNPL